LFSKIIERSVMNRINRTDCSGTKGVKDAPPDELVRDWWNKMLAVICRMQDGQRRAIVAAYPNPLLASKRFQEMGYTLAVRELSELQTEAGRRLGPVMAHRLFMILTDVSGLEIVG
uniref:Crossover junction endonuclease MUS81 n=1 Tax=Haemonchus placei TaxID=6290 RepID=A0A0N4W5J2_HAEPC